MEFAIVQETFPLHWVRFKPVPGSALLFDGVVYSCGACGSWQSHLNMLNNDSRISTGMEGSSELVEQIVHEHQGQ